MNESGTYNIFFQSYFKDVCDSIWSLSSSLSFDILDCPLIVDIVASTKRSGRKTFKTLRDSKKNYSKGFWTLY